jgi:hypothetical protein
MKSLTLWICCVVALMASNMTNAEYIDKAPAIPYKQSELLKFEAAFENNTDEKFHATLGSDLNAQLMELYKRSGKIGQQILDDKTCDDENVSNRPSELKAHCADRYIDSNIIINTITRRETFRETFRMAGYSFDKSLVVFANNCKSLGSCDAATQDIMNLTGYPPGTTTLVKIFAMACSGSTPSVRNQLMPPNVAAACVKIMSSEPFKSKVCELKIDALKQGQSFCSQQPKEVADKMKYCSPGMKAWVDYPEIDCD